MAIITKQVAVTTTSQSIISVDNVQRDVLLHAKHEVYIGNSGVTSSNGYLMDNGDEVNKVPNACAAWDHFLKKGWH